MAKYEDTARAVAKNIVRNISGYTVFAVIMVFSLLGVVLLNQGRAAEGAVNAEPENGTLSSAASTVYDAGASGGQAVQFGSAGGGGMQRLRVAPDGRTFETADGKPFFLMADTGWSLLYNLTREQTIEYLDNRAAKGFNVIWAAALNPPSVNRTFKNVYGDLAYSGNIGALQTTPGNNPANAAEYDYWDHVDFVAAESAKRNIYLGILPAWGWWENYLNLVNATNGEPYGKFLGDRYGAKYPNVIWMMGGDWPQGNMDFNAGGWGAVARGITKSTAGGVEDYSKTFMTYHTGDYTSAHGLHNEPWLDFNTSQLGHNYINSSPWFWDDRNFALSKTPAKPFIDGEPTYEEHPVNFTCNGQYANAFETRAFAYMGVFDGSGGHTYGHHNIWQFYGSGYSSHESTCPRPINWKDAMNSAGAVQMGYFTKLMKARPMPISRDQSLLKSGTFPKTSSAIHAARANHNGFILVYSGQGNGFSLDTSRLSGTAAKGYWFDPRTGSAAAVGVQKGAAVQFNPPTSGANNDWVLVAEDAGRNYPAL